MNPIDTSYVNLILICNSKCELFRLFRLLKFFQSFEDWVMYLNDLNYWSYFIHLSNLNHLYHFNDSYSIYHELLKLSNRVDRG